MGAGHIYISNKRVIAVTTVLPEGCAECSTARNLAEPARESFRRMKDLGGITIVDNGHKVTMPSELAEEEPHKSELEHYDIVTSELGDLLIRCSQGAEDVYTDGDFVGIRCGANGLTQIK